MVLPPLVSWYVLYYEIMIIRICEFVNTLLLILEIIFLDDIVERIYNLMKSRKVTAKEVSTETGIAQSSFTDWKNGRSKPGADALKKIADYFDVSTDYLLGRVEDPRLTIVDIPERFKKKYDKADIEVLRVAKEAVEEGLTAADFRNILKTYKKINNRK
jgi:transcriptional regulator with XRE-family HTH domain